MIAAQTGIAVDPDAIFDVHIKRIHEYKRQLLNILQTVAAYQAILAHPERDWPARVKIFGGKAAASYRQAKLIIKLINDVARVVNQDPVVGDRLKVVFLPNYNVSLTERIIPAADLSEQISTAGMEASGTGNMKLALNGALTIGTLDGANIEIRDLVGHDNMFIFGLTAEEVQYQRANGYDPRAAAAATPALDAGARRDRSAAPSRPTIPAASGPWSSICSARTTSWCWPISPPTPRPSGRSTRTIATAGAWWRRAILNTAQVGWFSSDRTIRDYAGEIWQALPSRPA